MREVRERSFGEIGVRKDFRASLVSIFVDNLNPIVDLKCLWGIFKAFGLVKDVYLSSKSRNRKSCFAFIRFATMIEAERVVGLTNGMHIYGWSIISKVASVEWANRGRNT